MSARPLTILLTGFGPFPGAPSNPSAQIVSLLGGAPAQRLARLGVRLETRILPVVFADGEARLATLITEIQPDAILHIGLAGRRRKLGVEARGRNRLTRLFHDAARALPAARHVLRDGPEFRAARLPLAEIAHRLRRAGAASEISRDAGAYVCNQTLYLSLGAEVPLAGFIHVPRPRGRLPLARVRRPRIGLRIMAKGIEEALVALAREARRANRSSRACLAAEPR